MASFDSERRHMKDLRDRRVGVDEWRKFSQASLEACTPLYYLVDTRTDIEEVRRQQAITGKWKSISFPPQMDVIKYLVEERGLKDEVASLRALQCGHIDVADYLHTHGSPVPKGNYIYEISSMMWAREHGYTFSEDALSDVMRMWNGSTSCKRLMLLLSWYPQFVDRAISIISDNYPTNSDKYLCAIIEKFWDDEDARHAILKHISIWCKRGYGKSITSLLDRGVDLSPYIFDIASGPDLDLIKKVMDVYDISPTTVANILISTDDREDEEYLDILKEYSVQLRDFKDIIERENIVSKCIENRMWDSLYYLLVDHKISKRGKDLADTAREILGWMWDGYCQVNARGCPGEYREHLLSLCSFFAPHFILDTFIDKYENGYPEDPSDTWTVYGDIEDDFRESMEETQWE